MLVIQDLEQHPGCLSCKTWQSVKCRCKWGQKGCVGNEPMVKTVKNKAKSQSIVIFMMWGELSV